jgi:hypothetical protein
MVGAQKWELSKYNLLNDDSICRIILNWNITCILP